MLIERVTSVRSCCIGLIFLLVKCIPVFCQDVNETITIQLNGTTSEFNSELYGGYQDIGNLSTIKVNFENVNVNVSFIIFQVHSYFYNVTLYERTMSYGKYVNGTNVGLYSLVKPTVESFYIFNPNHLDLKLYITVHGYTNLDVIPGGCNMEFPVPISPYLVIENHEEYILVEGSPGKPFQDRDCMSELLYEFYMLYLPDRDFSSDTYFDSLKKMLTFENIMEYGDLIPSSGGMWNMRRMLSSYPGTGVVFVAVVRSAKGYGVYVPTVTYGCTPIDGSKSCELIDDAFSQLMCAMLLFGGVFFCYFGHRFFKTEMFLTGAISGSVITYILLSILSDLDRPALIGATLISGVFFGAIWLLFWWFYGIPIAAVLLATLNLGFLFACVTYNRFPGGIELLEIDLNFWIVFIFIIIMTAIIMVPMTFLANIVCCTVLGSYAVVYPIDYYIGSNLKYIIVNTIRRAVVPKFSKAVLATPFGWNDALLTLLWVVLSLTGFLFQHYHSRGKPPFPPRPRSVRPRAPTTDQTPSNYGTIRTLFAPRFPRRSTPIPREEENGESAPLIA